MSNIEISLGEINEYFEDYDIYELRGRPNSCESVKAYLYASGICVVMERSYKKDEYTKAKSKSISICIPYEDLLNADCFVTFLDEKLNSVLTNLRDEVK